MDSQAQSVPLWSWIEKVRKSFRKPKYLFIFRTGTTKSVERNKEEAVTVSTSNRRMYSKYSSNRAARRKPSASKCPACSSNGM